jgi:hypothetical protein
MDTIALSVPPGVARGATPATTPGRWYDANLVRWHGGGLMPIGGWVKINDTALPSTPRRLLPWADNAGLRRTAVACEGHLVIETSGEFFNATPGGFTAASVSLTTGGYGSGFYGTEDWGDERENVTDVNTVPYTYSLATWGQDLLALNSSDGRLLQWTPSAPTTAATVVSGAPTGNRAMTVTDERHVVVIGGATNPRRISWSSRESLTDWDFSSTTNTAGFIEVEADAPLLHCVKVREGVLIFSESDIFLMRYVGLPFVYGVDRIATSGAPLSPLSVATFDGRAAWMGREGFYLYDGGSVTPVLSDVQDWVFDELDRGFGRFYAHASNNGLFPEVWFFYPDLDSGDGNPNRYIIWNYAEKWWSIGALRRTAMAEAGVFRWPLATCCQSNFYQHEQGQLANGDTRVGSVYAETATLSLGTGDKLMHVVHAQPDSMRGADATSFVFYGRFTREGVERSYGPYVARPDGYMDVRLSTRDIRLRVGSRKDEPWTVGGMRLTITQGGRR